MPNWFGYLLDFVYASENLVMVDDVVMPSDFLVALVEKEELEEVSLDVNVNGCAKKNCPEEWCALKSIVRHGIIDYVLTQMP